MSSPWNPNTFRRSDVAVLERNEAVLGRIPPLCKECRYMDHIRPYTHVVIANTGTTRHLTRLIRDLDSGGNGKTFCNRLFSFKPLIGSQG